MSHLQASIINFETGDIVPSGIVTQKTYVVQRTADAPTLINNAVAGVIPDMSVVAKRGQYLVSFNGQFIVNDTSSLTLSTKTELIALYDELVALTATVTNHAAAYGSGETLSPGVYTQAAASSLVGTLTLDGGGDSSALFVFRCAGAFATAASSEIVLTNGATSNNVWFVAEGAASTGASTIFRGSLLANQAAASTGASTEIEGRLLAITGAVGVGAATIFTTPTGTSASTLGTFLPTFSIFAGTGSVSNTGASEVPLNIGTNAGTITGFETATVEGLLYPAGEALIGKIFYGIYVDGVLTPHSLRSATRPHLLVGSEFPMIISTVISVTRGQTIDIRAYSSIGEHTIDACKILVVSPISNVIFS
jgi:hypothetical protein